MRRESQVAVHFIGDDQHAVAGADIAQRGELLAGPDPPDRIVRVAEIDHPGARIGRRGLEPGKVHAVAAVLQHQRVGDHRAAVLSQDVEKVEEDRRLHDDAVRPVR